MMGLTVMAFADDTQSTGGNQIIQAEVPGPSWELVIPADQTIEYLAEVTDIVHANCAIQNARHIPANNTINATLTHTGVFTMSGEGNEDKKIAFTMRAYNQKDVAAGTPVTVAQYWSDLKVCYSMSLINVMIPRETWQGAESGTYTTPVTYTSALANEITPAADGSAARE